MVVKGKKTSGKMKFAIIETGGKQYEVSSGDVLKVEKFRETYKNGDKITFDKVLLLDDGKGVQIGLPYIEGAKIEAVFEKSGQEKKISLMKYKSKTRYLKRFGHRQPYALIKIT